MMRRRAESREGEGGIVRSRQWRVKASGTARNPAEARVRQAP